jgi:asparagine synthase (glutamine-hydrolysing)
MCGICGKAALSSTDRVDPATVERMMETLFHRGPDDQGMYVTKQVALGHRRLSIIDLNTGKQPICNEDGTVWIVYNGEIYNFKQLKQELVQSGHVFATNTDTEVIVHVYEQYGEECLSKLRGMFAFALWDDRKKILLLARDRVGIKPLYYVHTQESLIFASEMKALLVDPSVKREVAPQVIDTFLTYFYTPGCETLIRGIQKLEPGHYLLMEDGKVKVRQYWDLEFAHPARNGDFTAATDELVELLRETVRDHMISDVPVGILLSGGVDSTGVLSFAVEQTEKDINTFTIGFDGGQFADERLYAKLAAQRFGNKHYEMTITPRDFEEFLPKYVWHMEEPVCEPPAVALYYVTKLARQHVKVLLSGEGGDEAFAGYQNYRNMVWLERLKTIGQPWTGMGAKVLGECGRIRAFRRFEKYSFMMKTPLERYYYSRTAGPFSYFNRNKPDLYSKEFRREVDSDCSTKIASDLFAHVASQPPLNRMLYVDTKTWLPDDLLVKADKITMANSLELRVPLLDHKVLEFAARLPQSYKVKGFKTKYILKKALGSRVPREILNRRKAGFPVPLTSWLTNELRDYACGILTDRRTLERGYFNKSHLRALVQDRSRAADYAQEIFCLLTLELWHRTFVDAN